jgi:hypothetical protein
MDDFHEAEKKKTRNVLAEVDEASFLVRYD